MENISALMMSRNEEDIIGHTLTQFSKFNIPVLCLDHSTDSTPNIVQSFNNTFLYRQTEIFGDTASGEWMLGALLYEARRMFGFNQYIVIFLADEFWTRNPREIVEEMKSEAATFAVMESLQFFPHINDKPKYDFENKRWRQDLSPMEQLKYFSPGWKEDKIFLDNGSDYEIGKRYCMIPEGSKIKEFSKNPYYLHYPLREPVRILDRCRDRVDRAWQMNYSVSYNKQLEDCFYESIQGIPKEMTLNRDNFIL